MLSLLLSPLDDFSVSVDTSMAISGWKISDRSVRAGLQSTCLVGRSQFLTPKEAETLGLPGATILLDGGDFYFLIVTAL